MSEQSAKQELGWAHQLLDELGVPREEYAAQARGEITFTLAGRIDRLAQQADKAEFDVTAAGERALRWEALARQLGDALADANGDLKGFGSVLSSKGAAALSVYRDAIKEDGS